MRAVMLGRPSVMTRRARRATIPHDYPPGRTPTLPRFESHLIPQVHDPSPLLPCTSCAAGWIRASPARPRPTLRCHDLQRPPAVRAAASFRLWLLAFASSSESSSRSRRALTSMTCPSLSASSLPPSPPRTTRTACFAPSAPFLPPNHIRKRPSRILTPGCFVAFGGESARTLRLPFGEGEHTDVWVHRRNPACLRRPRFPPQTLCESYTGATDVMSVPDFRALSDYYDEVTNCKATNTCNSAEFAGVASFFMRGVILRSPLHTAPLGPHTHTLSCADLLGWLPRRPLEVCGSLLLLQIRPLPGPDGDHLLGPLPQRPPGLVQHLPVPPVEDAALVPQGCKQLVPGK